jgi:hypothetical protein
MKAHEAFLKFDELTPLLDQLAQAVEANDVSGVRANLQTAVLGYQPSSQVADLIYRKTSNRK